MREWTTRVREGCKVKLGRSLALSIPTNKKRRVQTPGVFISKSMSYLLADGPALAGVDQLLQVAFASLGCVVVDLSVEEAVVGRVIDGTEDSDRDGEILVLA